MTRPGSSGRPERDPAPRMLPDVKLEWLHVRCPECPHVTEMPERGSDGELDLLWEHLRTHTRDPLVLLGLWTTAMGGAR